MSPKHSSSRVLRKGTWEIKCWVPVGLKIPFSILMVDWSLFRCDILGSLQSTQGILPYIPASSVTMEGPDAFWVPALFMWSAPAGWIPVSFYLVSSVLKCPKVCLLVGFFLFWPLPEWGFWLQRQSKRKRKRGKGQRVSLVIRDAILLHRERLAIFSWLLWTLALLSWASNVSTFLSDFPYFVFLFYFRRDFGCLLTFLLIFKI